MLFVGIRCDNCGATSQYHNRFGKVMTKKLAREKGWSIDKKDLCPECNSRNKVKQN